MVSVRRRESILITDLSVGSIKETPSWAIHKGVSRIQRGKADIDLGLRLRCVGFKPNKEKDSGNQQLSHGVLDHPPIVFALQADP